MRSAGDEVNLNDFLTLYLKQFKTSLHAQLCLIQFLSSNQNLDDTSNINEKIEKVTQASKQINQQLKQMPKINYKMNGKTLQRFCLRINQFVQYRIAKCKGLVSDIINSELNAFCDALHRTFTEINKDKDWQDQQQSLSILFTKINEIQNKYMIKILINLIKNYRKSQSTSYLIQQLIKSKMQKNIIKNQIKNQNQISNVVDQSKIINVKKIDFARKINQSHYISRLRSRKTTFQKKLLMPSIRSNPTSITAEIQRKLSSVSSHLLARNTQDLTQQNMRIMQYDSIKSSENLFYKKLQDVIQFGNDYDNQDKQTQDDLMKKLTENNKNNSVIIHKFRKKVNKNKLKLMENYLMKQQDTTLDFQVKHRRSYTLDTSQSKPSFKKQTKFIGLPSLKRKNAKI